MRAWIVGFVTAGLAGFVGAPPASAEYGELFQHLDPIHVVTLFDHGCGVCAGTVEAVVGTRYQTSVVVYLGNHVAGGSSAGTVANLLVTVNWVTIDTGRAGTASAPIASSASVPIDPGSGRIAATLYVDAPHLRGGGVFEVRG